MKVVHIKWRDAAAVTGWRGMKSLKRISKSDLSFCETVGMLVSETKKKVVIVHTVGASEVSGVFEIPMGCIESVKEICTLPVKLK